MRRSRDKPSKPASGSPPKDAVPTKFYDPLMVRAALRDERERGVRQRVCSGCHNPETDKVLGRVIHSELPCHRCGEKPCEGLMVELRKVKVFLS
jgi:hypothetical protein